MSQWTPTTCMRCAVGCGLLQRSDGTELTDVRGDPSHPATCGADCKRGVQETLAAESKRLTKPLVRRGGTLQPTDWDTAIGVVATRFIEAVRADSGNVAVFGSGQQTNEAAYALGKLARGGLGTPHYDANTGLCMASAITAYDHAFGGNAPPPTYDDIPAADTHLIWGANPATAHPVLFNWVVNSANDGGQIVVIDPVESKTAARADTHIQLKPGADLALARGVIAHIVDTGGVDTTFVKSNTTGYDCMADALPAVQEAAETAGVTVDDIETIADAVDAKTLLYWGMGVNQNIQGTATARALIDLCLVTGNLGPGSGPFSLTGQANSMGNRVCASKETWPGHQQYTDQSVRKTVANTWNVPFSRLPTGRGDGFVSIINRMARGEIDICWTVATNPAVGLPDADHVRSVLEDVFLVVQDAFRSQTVECADVVLPAATWGETTGTTMNMERRVAPLSAAVEPPGEARQDLDIIAAIGNRIEPELFDEPPLDPSDVFAELRSITAGAPADLSGISYERLERHGAVRWPAADTDSEGGYLYFDDGEWSFDTDSGLAAFSSGTHSGVAEPVDGQYPLTLTTGRSAGVYNTGVRNAETLTDGLPRARMHPRTITEQLAAFDRGRTVVESRRGSVTVAVEPDEGIPRGLVWLPIHNPAVNTLTLPTVDPQSDEPNYKQCAVRIRAPTETDPVAETEQAADTVNG
ncbi:assimilatory nitrate reductase [Natronomonas pharaonis DSM 2160]|uniref:Assimilatory nitrate reductase n=1 Tax=Natronomonas pharaonis (strain ATCC 35678 / DSM 2160 / CIP 103997 / JCM 8858 / NBRC 14720 / NCIMB 2260 / Gabara) TaxID=348780 RepID=A0A1U7EYB2_NATPD|nr:assimilatory nitrate reductase NasA [Natronomonas pharaonis]CAI50204.1 assimilatory nitrate reductase [Natronomonas pharaonis DSM 2160]